MLNVCACRNHRLRLRGDPRGRPLNRRPDAGGGCNSRASGPRLTLDALAAGLHMEPAPRPAPPAAGLPHDLRRAFPRGPRGLRRRGLRDRRRAGRDRHGAGARRRRAAGAAARIRRAGAAAGGAGAVGGGALLGGDPPRAGDRGGAPARRRLEPLGRALPAVRPDRLPQPALARARRPGRSARTTWRRRQARRLRRARRRRAGLARAAARGRGRRRLRLREPRALEQRAADPGAAPRRRSPTGADLLVALGATALGFAPRRTAGWSAVELHLEGRGPGRHGGRRRWCSPPAATRAPGCCSPSSSAGTRRSSAARTGRSGASTWATSTARSPTSSSTSAALDDGLDFHQTATAATSAAGWCRPGDPGARTRLPNVAFWPVVPAIADPAHRSGPLSAVFLALSVGAARAGG